MHKRIFFFMLIVFALLIATAGIGAADDVVVSINLSTNVTKWVNSSPPSFAPVAVSLVVENLSDRIQTLTLKAKYHFRLITFTGGSYTAAEGDLVSTYAKLGPTVQVQPHSKLLVAFGWLPNDCTWRSVALLPDKYMLKVEFPDGLPGSPTGSQTETALFIIP